MEIVENSFSISTKERNQMINITGQVDLLVSKAAVKKGDVIVYCPHTTAAITINENADPDVQHDILLTLEELIPHNNPLYRHTEGNSDSHCKSSLLGCSKQILIKGGKLTLGTWQAIFFCEFDGPRNRNVIVQIRGE